MQASSTTLVAGSTSYQPSSFVGTTPSYTTAKNIEIASGASFTTQDVTDHARKVVIGPTVAENLFSGSSPVGQTIRVNGTSFTVIGVTASKGSDGTSDQDDVVLAPLTAVQDTLSGYGSISSITVQATSAASLDAAQAEVESILYERKDVTDTSNPGFNVINQGSVREASSASTDVFTTLLGAVAAISLLVGGIGVMNIMLVSVTERTREIGIRKAIGARRADILQQFLVEAILVSVIGGALGVALGLGREPLRDRRRAAGRGRLDRRARLRRRRPVRPVLRHLPRGACRTDASRAGAPLRIRRHTRMSETNEPSPAGRGASCITPVTGVARRGDRRRRRLHRRRPRPEEPGGDDHDRRDARRRHAPAGGMPGGGGPPGVQGATGGDSTGTAGTVAYTKGSTLYVKDAEGNTIKVRVKSSAKVDRTASTDATDVQPGDSVVVQGDANAKGTVTATSITATEGATAG